MPAVLVSTGGNNKVGFLMTHIPSPYGVIISGPSDPLHYHSLTMTPVSTYKQLSSMILNSRISALCFNLQHVMVLTTSVASLLARRGTRNGFLVIDILDRFIREKR